MRVKAAVIVILPFQSGIGEIIRLREMFWRQSSERRYPQDQQDAAWKRFAAGHPGDDQRIFFGRAEDKSAVLRLKDTEGRDCIVIEVNPDGVCVQNRQNDGQFRLEEARNPGHISIPP
jgi:hypothetical protein